MSSFGVLSTGFRAKTLQDILDEIEDAQRAAFGPAINTQADSVLGQLNGIYADQLSELWEVANAVYRARQPDSASDEALDNVAAITGAVRLSAARSTVTLLLNLDDGTTVGAGKVVSIGPNGEQWQSIAPVTNTSGFNATVAGLFESVNFGPIAGNPGTIDTIKTPVSGWSAQASINSLNSEPFFLEDLQTLLIEIDGAAAQTVTFNTADFGDINNATAQEVIDAILDDISSGIDGLDVGGMVRLTSDLDGSGSSLRIAGGSGAEALGFSQARFKGMNPSTPAQVICGGAAPFNLNDGETLTLKIDGSATQIIDFNTGEFGDINNATAVEVAKAINTDIVGGVAYVIGDKVQIESFTVGVNSEVQVTGGTSNPELGFPELPFSGESGAATPGRNLETDPEFRLRRENLLRISGAATLGAIRAAILNLNGVLQCFIFENPTDFTDLDGRPPHSFEAVVAGGDDTEVAQTIFDTKPVGIQTYRDPGPDGRTVTITDIQGFDHDIEYSRPTSIQMYVEVDIDVDGTLFGGGDQVQGEIQVKDAIKAVGDLQQIGQDVIIIQFRCAPLEVAGVIDVPVIKIEDVFPPTNTSNIAIAGRELAIFSTADMVVNVNIL